MNRIGILVALGLVGLVGGCENEPFLQGPSLNNTQPNPPAPVNPRQVDRIVQVAQPQVDILFIVDDSCSMSEEQDALASNFGLFMDYFTGSGLDYHIGVTTTDMDSSNTNAGRLRRTTRAGRTYRFIDETTTNPVAVFGDLVVAGTNGSFEERGRQAAYALLETNRDLPRNEGFYREDASLHMVFVSDEEDQSVSPPLSEWNPWMRDLKYDSDLVKSHAIVGLPNQSCFAVTEAGQLYVNYTNRTGGIAFDLCTPSWAGLLEELGLQTSGLKREYFLSKIPVTDPWSLDVRVEVEIEGNMVTRRFPSCLPGEEVFDTDCEVNYNAGRNSIVFLNYVPEPFSEVYAEYNIREIFGETTENEAL